MRCLLNLTLLVAATLATTVSTGTCAQELANWPDGTRLTPVNPLATSLYLPKSPNTGLSLLSSSLEGDDTTRVLPVVRTENGRIEALLFIDAAHPESLNPVDRLMNRGVRASSAGIGASLRVTPGSRLTLGADLRSDRSPGLALLCNEDIGLATTLSSLSQHCLLAQLGGDADPLASFGQRQTSQQRVSATLQLPESGLDLDFGLSWLDSRALISDPAPSLSGFGSNTLFDPALRLLSSQSLIDPAFDNLRLRSEGLGVRGMLDLGSRRWLSLDSQISRNRVDGDVIEALMPTSWKTGRLGLGVGIGDFSGQLSGHVIDVSGSNALWGGLDIGVSWRTPWRAALTIGARNVVSGGNKSWPSEDIKALDEAQSRIPYVQYQQDL